MKEELELDRQKTAELREELADMEKLAKAHLGVSEIKYDESRFIKFEKPRRVQHTAEMAELEREATEIQEDMTKLGIELETDDATDAGMSGFTPPKGPNSDGQKADYPQELNIKDNVEAEKSTIVSSQPEKEMVRQASASTISTESDKPSSKPPSRPGSSRAAPTVSEAVVIGPPQNTSTTKSRVSSASLPGTKENIKSNSKPKPLNTSEVSDGGSTPRVISARDAARGTAFNSTHQNPPKKPSSILPAISGLEITGVNVSGRQLAKK